jgi:ABC-type dipeptide/oligopeptide/nickel transport system permease subunit
MALRNLDFVSASKALGATDLRIAFGTSCPTS